MFPLDYALMKMCDQTNCNVEHNTGTFWILKSCVLKFYLDAIDEADSYLIQINWLLDKQSNTLSNIKSIEWGFFYKSADVSRLLSITLFLYDTYTLHNKKYVPPSTLIRNIIHRIAEAPFSYSITFDNVWRHMEQPLQNTLNEKFRVEFLHMIQE